MNDQKEMFAAGNQRWRERKAIFRRPDEQIKTADFEVAPIELDVPAKAFVEDHHYSGSYPSARFRYGLYKHADLVGVAVFSHPQRDEVLTRVFATGDKLDSTELGRFVLTDTVRGNGETWFLARCFELLRAEGILGVVSFSDPLPRQDENGLITMPGHVGTIYQAMNGRYLGRSKRETLRLLPNGQSITRRTIAKIRSGKKGWNYSVRKFTAFGFPAPRCLATEIADVDELNTWLDRALEVVTRPVCHPGNHKYAWAVNKKAKRFLPELNPAIYPKKLITS